MKTTPTLIALGLLALTGAAQAATWTLDGTTLGGLRVGAVSFDGLPAGVAIGNLTDDLDSVTPAFVAAGSWRSLAANNGSNGIDLGLSHEAHVQTSFGGDPATVAARLQTSVSLDKASIGVPTVLSAVGLSPATIKQTFVITPELGEHDGLPVWVSFSAAYAHEADLAGGLSSYHFSSYNLYLNDVWFDADHASGLGNGSGNWMFPAAIGDRLTLELFNTTQLGAANFALTPASLGPSWATGRVDVSLTVSPIPEPETWAMLLAGLGLVGLQLRRKTRINPKLEI